MSSEKHTARLSFSTDEATYLRTVLGPEVEREVPKCFVTWLMDVKEGHLVIEAEDLGALRAALNSYMRWTYLALGVREKVEKSDDRRSKVES